MMRTSVMGCAVVSVIALLSAGCAKQPATFGASAPAPTGRSTLATPTGMGTGTGTTTATGSGPLTGSSSGSTLGSSTRPPVADFTAIAELADVHFDFDRYDIRPDAGRTLDSSAAWLKSRAGHLVLIEGHCDERGTNEYNLALGERRAKAAMNYLVSRGVDARRITVISYGEDRPQCRERAEACWAKNRRAHFRVKAQ